MRLLRKKPWAPTGVMVVRKLADTSDGERVVRYHPLTSERMLVRPETIQQPGFNYAEMKREPWPLAGVVPLQLPDRCVVGTRWIERGIEEGWIVLENPRWVHRPGGPPSDPFAVTHSFHHADAIVFAFQDGAVRYRVVSQPDKWPETKDGDLGFGGEVHWTYWLERDRG